MPTEYSALLWLALRMLVDLMSALGGLIILPWKQCSMKDESLIMKDESLIIAALL